MLAADPVTANVESMDREELVQAILDLERDREAQIEDVDLPPFGGGLCAWGTYFRVV